MSGESWSGHPQGPASKPRGLVFVWVKTDCHFLESARSRPWPEPHECGGVQTIDACCVNGSTQLAACKVLTKILGPTQILECPKNTFHIHMHVHGNTQFVYPTLM